MATTVATTDIRGRLGTYTLTIYDVTDAASEVTPFSISEPLTIRWGEEGRDYPEQILKSYCRIQVEEGAAEIRSLFTGAFAADDYPARITGPGVDWSGFVTPEERRLPFNSRVTRERTSLLLSDGIYLGDTQFPTVNVFGFTAGLNDYFNNGPFDVVDGTGYTVGDFARCEGVFLDEDDNTYDASSSDLLVDALAGFGSGGTSLANPYDRFVDFMAFQRLRMYKSLSENALYVHPLRETGQDLEYAFEDLGTISTTTRTKQVVDIDASDVLFPVDESFQTLEAAGDINLEVSDGYQPSGGASFSDEYNLIRGGLSSITTATSQTNILDEAIFALPAPQFQLNLDAGSSADGVIKAEIGTIDPEDAIGIVVDWDVEVRVGSANEKLEVEIDYNEGFTDPVASETDGVNNTRLIGPIDTDIKTIVVRFTGNDVTVTPTVRFIRSGTIVETLRLTGDARALKPVGRGYAIPPRLETAGILSYSTPKRWRPARDLTGTSDGSALDDPAYENNQFFLTSAFLEQEYRPTGTLHFENRLNGLYGPETALLVPTPDGTDRLFVCGTGREVNLTDGTTRVSDVEIPTDILPGGALPTPS